MDRLSFQGESLEGDIGVFCLARVSLVRPRRSFHRSSSSLALALSGVNSRKSFSYDKLAQVPIQLTIIKLDGSSFAINVTKSATIADLKQAVEHVFGHLSTKGLDEISWRHVWGHFCLSYGGRKLLNDSEKIRDYGIKDGDELHFVRHVSVSYNLINKRSRKRLDVLRPCTIRETSEKQLQEVEEGDVYQRNPKCHEYKYETVACGSLQSVRCESRAIQKSHQPYRTGGGLVGYFRSLLHFCDKRVPSHSSKVSQLEI